MMKRMPSILLLLAFVGSAEAGVVSPERHQVAVREGRVVNERGEGVSGARVWHSAQGPETYGIPSEEHSATADEDGYFTLEHPIYPNVDEIFVHVFARGYALSSSSIATIPASPLLVQLSHSVTIDGKVITDEGAPVAGAAVVARPVIMTSSWPAGAFSADPPDAVITSREGTYSIPVTAGIWKVAALREGWVAASSEPITVETRSVRAEPIAIARGLTVTGKVVDSEGKGLGRVVIALADELHQLRETTDSTGKFELGGVAAGKRTLSVEYAGTLLHHEVNVSAEMVPAAVTLPRLGRISGIVRDAVRDTAIEEAYVHLWSLSSEHRNRSRSTRTDSSGRFTFENVPEGEIILVASTPELVPLWTQPRLWNAERSLEYELELSEGLELTGRVADENGEPVRATVIVETDRHRVGMTHFYDTRAATDSDGRFRIERIAPGVRKVTIQARCCKPVEETVRFTGSSEQLDITVRRRGIIAGTAVDFAGSPVAGLSVRATMQDSTKGKKRSVRTSAQTDESGRFRFEGLDDGIHSISVQHDSLTSPEVAAKPDDLEIELVLVPGASIYGTIVGIDDRSYMDAVPREGGHTVRARVDRNGRYELGGLAQGVYDLRLTSGRERIPLQAITITPPERLAFDFDVRSLPASSGRILVNGELLENPELYWSGDHGKGFARGGLHGSIKARGLVDGSFRATILGRNIGWIRTELDVRDHQFEVFLEGGPAIIKVVDPRGAPVSGALVRFGGVRGMAVQAKQTRSNEGIAEIPFLPYGPFRLWIEYGGWFSEINGDHRRNTASPARFEVQLKRP